MDVRCLEPDELSIEFEIRHLPAGPTNLELLHAKILAEESFPILTPKTPHASGIRNPATEIRLCSLKLARMTSFLDSKPTFTDELIRQLRSRLCHIRGRLFRLHCQDLDPEKVNPIARDCEGVFQILNQIQNSRQIETSDSDEKPRNPLSPPGSPKRVQSSKIQSQSYTNLDSVVPAIDKTPRLEPEKIPQADRYVSCFGNLLDMFPPAENSSDPLHFTPLPSATTCSVDPGLGFLDFLKPTGDQGNISATNSKESRQDFTVNPVTPTDLQSVVNTFGSMLIDFRRSLADSSRPIQTSSTAPERYDSNRMSLPNSSNISRILLGWNLKFSGSKDDVPVERFVARVDQMAKGSGINLNDCIQNLTCLLSGVALEWFWVTVERDPGVNWEGLKPAIILRFNRGITNREIRRMLDDRKQKYPQESYGDFQDAILQLGLQGVPPIPDNELLDVLLNNMRPGLQLALAGKYIYNIGQLAQEARCLETLWKQLKHNPEANTGVSRGLLHELNTSDSTSVSHSSELETVCAFNKASEPSGRKSILKRDTTTFQCWNCKSTGHTFQLCRQPRTIFCYGCGLTDTYLPDCPKCQNQSAENLSMRDRYPRDPIPQSHHIPSKIRFSEAASNTDPELYLRPRPKPD